MQRRAELVVGMVEAHRAASLDRAPVSSPTLTAMADHPTAEQCRRFTICLVRLQMTTLRDSRMRSAELVAAQASARFPFLVRSTLGEDWTVGGREAFKALSRIGDRSVDGEIIEEILLFGRGFFSEGG